MAQRTAFGRYASWASRSRPEPTSPGLSWLYIAVNTCPWLAIDTAVVSAPAAASTTSEPAAPARIDRDRADISAPSLRHGASARAAPNQVATNATANPARIACGIDAVARADLLPTASAAAITA